MKMKMERDWEDNYFVSVVKNNHQTHPTVGFHLVCNCDTDTTMARWRLRICLNHISTWPFVFYNLPMKIALFSTWSFFLPSFFFFFLLLFACFFVVLFFSTEKNALKNNKIFKNKKKKLKVAQLNVNFFLHVGEWFLTRLAHSFIQLGRHLVAGWLVGWLGCCCIAILLIKVDQ